MPSTNRKWTRYDAKVALRSHLPKHLYPLIVYTSRLFRESKTSLNRQLGYPEIWIKHESKRQMISAMVCKHELSWRIQFYMSINSFVKILDGKVAERDYDKYMVQKRLFHDDLSNLQG